MEDYNMKKNKLLKRIGLLVFCIGLTMPFCMPKDINAAGDITTADEFKEAYETGCGVYNLKQDIDLEETSINAERKEGCDLLIDGNNKKITGNGSLVLTTSANYTSKQIMLESLTIELTKGFSFDFKDIDDVLLYKVVNVLPETNTTNDYQHQIISKDILTIVESDLNLTNSSNPYFKAKSTTISKSLVTVSNDSNNSKLIDSESLLMKESTITYLATDSNKVISVSKDLVLSKSIINNDENNSEITLRADNISSEDSVLNKGSYNFESPIASFDKTKFDAKDITFNGTTTINNSSDVEDASEIIATGNLIFNGVTNIDKTNISGADTSKVNANFTNTATLKNSNIDKGSNFTFSGITKLENNTVNLSAQFSSGSSIEILNSKINTNSLLMNASKAFDSKIIVYSLEASGSVVFERNNIIGTKLIVFSKSNTLRIVDNTFEKVPELRFLKGVDLFANNYIKDVANINLNMESKLYSNYFNNVNVNDRQSSEIVHNTFYKSNVNTTSTKLLGNSIIVSRIPNLSEQQKKII